MRMIKRALPILLAILILSMVGCSADAVAVESDLGTFHFIRAKLVDSFDTLSPVAGSKLLTLAFSAGEFDETQFSTHFVGDDTTEGAQVRVAGQTSPCKAVGYQGNEGENSVEYVLIFEVKGLEKLDNATIELKAPGKDWVTIK